MAGLWGEKHDEVVPDESEGLSDRHPMRGDVTHLLSEDKEAEAARKNQRSWNWFSVK